MILGMDEYRFRRVDGWNFAIESKHIVQDPKSKNFGEVRWEQERWYSDFRLMLKEAIVMGIEGEGAKTLLQALKASTDRVLKMLDEYVETGKLNQDDITPEEVAAVRRKEAKK